MKDMKMSKDISITAIATDDEIHQLWKIVGKILDRKYLNVLDVDSGELIVKIRSYEDD
tara:strand:- start:799 stop:972 length:174 start_codon:yes stop_codon:yes gene_type:complete